MKRIGGNQSKTKQTKTERPKVNIAATAGTYETEQMSSSQTPFSHTECDNAPTKVPEPGGCTNSPKTDTQQDSAVCPGPSHEEALLGRRLW